MPVIAYISQAFPSLTTTFVYREVQALRRLGLVIRPISTWRPERAKLSAEAQPLIDETYYLFPLRWPALLAAHMRWLFTRPGPYLGALALTVLFNREPLRNRLRSLGHFIYAALAAVEVERCGADHIHADFALNAATVALVAARLTGRPFSFAAHANDIFVNPVLLREKVRAAAFAAPISDFNRRVLLAAGGDPAAAGKLVVVRCGLEFSQFPPRPRPAPAGRPLAILAVGRLVEKKGFHILVEACRRLAAQGVAFECQIVGDGPEAPALRGQVAAAGLTERVRLAGALPQEQVRERFRQADLFALPCVVGRNNDQDGIPVVLMEAMAGQVPVISTTLSGIPELIQDGVSGLLVPPGDADALAAAIRRLGHDPALAERLAEQGRAAVARDFDVDQNAARLAALFASAIARRPFPPADP